MDDLYPVGYGTQLVTLDRLFAIHGPHMHPTFRTNLRAYLASKRGFMGIGGGYRTWQPDKPGFAPSIKTTFHGLQQFASGIEGYCAVDLVVRNATRVHRSPTWAEVADAPNFQLHAFIKTPNEEPWHMQPINIRGHSSWVAAGRPDPLPMPAPIPDPQPEPEDDDMRPVITYWQGEDPGYTISIAYDVTTASYYWASTRGDSVEALIAAGVAIDGRKSPLPQSFKDDATVKRVR